MHSHGLGEVHADMLERDREAAVAIEREVLAEAQLAVGVVVDLLDDVGIGARRRPVGRGGQRAGVLLQSIVGERLGWPNSRPVAAAAAGSALPKTQAVPAARRTCRRVRRSSAVVVHLRSEEHTYE